MSIHNKCFIGKHENMDTPLIYGSLEIQGFKWQNTSKKCYPLGPIKKIPVFLMTLKKTHGLSEIFVIFILIFQTPQSSPFYWKFLRTSCGHIKNDQLSAC